ncbi:MAG TPA: porin [Paenalcaligenes sp.]|nr:porin [Paenalcaligenes sp.]
MKKTLLAAALMVGFAGVAQAETSVTLYGVVDGGIGYQRLKGSAAGDIEGMGLYDHDRGTSFRNTRTGLFDGGAMGQRGNRWGLRGSEDLGDGLRFIFQLESGFNIATGNQMQGNAENDRLFGREAHFGLAGDNWGQLTFGRQTSITSLYMPGIASPFAASWGQANYGATFSAANTTRYDNSIQYQTPSFAGFQFGLGYSFNIDGAQRGTTKINGEKTKHDTKAWTAALRYANGPIAVGASYDQYTDRTGMKDYSTLDAGRVTAKEWALAGSYDFEMVKLHLGGGQTRDGFFTNQFNGYGLGQSFHAQKGLRVNNYTVGLSAPVGAGEIMASWAMGDLRKLPHGLRDADLKTKKQQTYSLGYTYPLSKRTNVYAIGSYAKNVNFAPDLKSTAVGVGVSHQF